MTEAEVAGSFETGARRWGEGRFFEAHEAFEVAWQATKHEPKARPAADPRRDFFHGLILYAAAYVHWSRSNRLGLARALAQARAAMARSPTRVLGVDVAGFGRAVEADLEAALAGRPFQDRRTPVLGRSRPAEPHDRPGPA